MVLSRIYIVRCADSAVLSLPYRKYTLLLNNVVQLVGVALQSFAIHPFMFIAGRLVVGVNSGETYCRICFSSQQFTHASVV